MNWRETGRWIEGNPAFCCFSCNLGTPRVNPGPEWSRQDAVRGRFERQHLCVQLGGGMQVGSYQLGHHETSGFRSELVEGVEYPKVRSAQAVPWKEHARTTLPVHDDTLYIQHRNLLSQPRSRRTLLRHPTSSCRRWGEGILFLLF